jgi:hypothetical protein
MPSLGSRFPGRKAFVPFGPKVRWKHYYRVVEAGRKAGWSKSEAYRRVLSGDLPVEHFSEKLVGVPKKPWDAIVARGKASVS